MTYFAAKIQDHNNSGSFYNEYLLFFFYTIALHYTFTLHYNSLSLISSLLNLFCYQNKDPFVKEIRNFVDALSVCVRARARVCV